MKHATKVTIKKLETIIKTANADPKNYYDDREMAAYRLLGYINQAEEMNRQSEELQTYDPEGYQAWSDETLNDPYAIYYTVNGLTIKGRTGEESYWLTGLSIKHPELVYYINCLDLNCATISDVNKLVKLIIG